MSTGPSSPPIVAELVARFAEHRDDYTQDRYNETQLRREFVDPLFEALGWDIHNRQNFAQSYKEVVHEDAIQVAGAHRAPDYCFRVGGVRKFFVETKKPAVDVAADAAAAFQLRRYAWSAKLPLSILTDFEELAVYDCRIRPDKDDKASVARVLLLRYTDYAERWPELAGVFSKEAILKGAFDKFAESTKRKRGTAEVDDAFLDEMETWRVNLARNIALRNPELPTRELNFAVQRIIDRIVFLRICEDRGIEPYGTLHGHAAGTNAYRRLVERFYAADDRYNSGLFQFETEADRPEGPDQVTPELSIDDKLIKDILGRLYYPDSPYDFRVLPADILGQVYERFLGKEIRLTAEHRAKVEEKPEVRKAGGVYYTPTYIVDYIVRQTVGELVKDKTPQEVGGLTDAWKPSKTRRPLTVLDPACGSGSFLLGAYQFLLDWYRDRYVESGPEQHASGRQPRLFQHRSGDWRLTSAERKRILLSHIYGVDIDPQAVEVTKLSLLLKVIEGENQETLDWQLRAFHSRALPDLGNNIKCGNSLVAPDFYAQRSLLDDDERIRINVFDWRGRDGFREIMQAGGFDAIVGNPPYVRMEMFKQLKDYLRARYEVHDERTDLYAYFIEREHKLLREGGLLGIIVSNKFLRAKYGRKVRELISRLASIRRLVDLAGLPVFRRATVRTIVLTTERSNRRTATVYSPPLDIESFRAVETGTVSLDAAASAAAYKLPSGPAKGSNWSLARPEIVAVMRSMQRNATPLAEFVDGRICMGIKSGLIDAFVVTKKTMKAILRKNSAARKIIYPFVQGRCIRRYEIDIADEYLIYTPHDIDMSPYPAVLEHLQGFRRQLEQRATEQKWYELQQPQLAYKEMLLGPKILFPDIATTCRFALDMAGFFCANTVYFIPGANLELLGLLNSSAAFFFFKQTCAALEGPGESYLRFFGQYLEQFPVPQFSGDRRAGSLVDAVRQMIQLRDKIRTTRPGLDRAALQRVIPVLDARIDEAVFELYGLTDRERRLIGEATRDYG